MNSNSKNIQNILLEKQNSFKEYDLNYPISNLKNKNEEIGMIVEEEQEQSQNWSLTSNERKMRGVMNESPSFRNKPVPELNKSDSKSNNLVSIDEKKTINDNKFKKSLNSFEPNSSNKISESNLTTKKVPNTQSNLKSLKKKRTKDFGSKSNGTYEMFPVRKNHQKIKSEIFSENTNENNGISIHKNSSLHEDIIKEITENNLDFKNNISISDMRSLHTYKNSLVSGHNFRMIDNSRKNRLDLNLIENNENQRKMQKNPFISNKNEEVNLFEESSDVYDFKTNDSPYYMKSKRNKNTEINSTDKRQRQLSLEIFQNKIENAVTPKNNKKLKIEMRGSSQDSTYQLTSSYSKSKNVNQNKKKVFELGDKKAFWNRRDSYTKQLYDERLSIAVARNERQKSRNSKRAISQQKKSQADSKNNESDFEFSLSNEKNDKNDKKKKVLKINDKIYSKKALIEAFNEHNKEKVDKTQNVKQRNKSIIRKEKIETMRKNKKEKKSNQIPKKRKTIIPSKNISIPELSVKENDKNKSVLFKDFNRGMTAFLGQKGLSSKKKNQNKSFFRKVTAKIDTGLVMGSKKNIINEKLHEKKRVKKDYPLAGVILPNFTHSIKQNVPNLEPTEILLDFFNIKKPKVIPFDNFIEKTEMSNQNYKSEIDLKEHFNPDILNFLMKNGFEFGLDTSFSNQFESEQNNITSIAGSFHGNSGRIFQKNSFTNPSDDSKNQSKSHFSNKTSEKRHYKKESIIVSKKIFDDNSKNSIVELKKSKNRKVSKRKKKKTTSKEEVFSINLDDDDKNVIFNDKNLAESNISKKSRKTFKSPPIVKEFREDLTKSNYSYNQNEIDEPMFNLYSKENKERRKKPTISQSQIYNNNQLAKTVSSKSQNQHQILETFNNLSKSSFNKNERKISTKPKKSKRKKSQKSMSKKFEKNMFHTMNPGINVPPFEKPKVIYIKKSELKKNNMTSMSKPEIHQKQIKIKNKKKQYDSQPHHLNNLEQQIDNLQKNIYIYGNPEKPKKKILKRADKKIKTKRKSDEEIIFQISKTENELENKYTSKKRKSKFTKENFEEQSSFFDAPREIDESMNNKLANFMGSMQENCIEMFSNNKKLENIEDGNYFSIYPNNSNKKKKMKKRNNSHNLEQKNIYGIDLAKQTESKANDSGSKMHHQRNKTIGLIAINNDNGDINQFKLQSNKDISSQKSPLIKKKLLKSGIPSKLHKKNKMFPKKNPPPKKLLPKKLLPPLGKQNLMKKFHSPILKKSINSSRKSNSSQNNQVNDKSPRDLKKSDAQRRLFKSPSIKRKTETFPKKKLLVKRSLQNESSIINNKTEQYEFDFPENDMNNLIEMEKNKMTKSSQDFKNPNQLLKDKIKKFNSKNNLKKMTKMTKTIQNTKITKITKRKNSSMKKKKIGYDSSRDSSLSNNKSDESDNSSNSD